MTVFAEFHDGSFDGILIQEKTAHIFVSTDEKQRYVFIARRVFALTANEFKEGNIIFDVSLRSASEIDEEELKTRSQEHPPHSATSIDGSQLNRARKQNLMALTIDPSYGATCLIFAEAFEKVSYKEWQSRSR